MYKIFLSQNFLLIRWSQKDWTILCKKPGWNRDNGRERRAEEERKREKEAEVIRQRMEEEERRVEEERINKQAEWKVELEAQIEQIKWGTYQNLWKFVVVEIWVI